MARSANTNYSAAGTEFEKATAGADAFHKEDVQKLAEAVDVHDHSSTHGLGVKRVQTGSIPAAAGEVRVNGDTLQWYGTALQTALARADFAVPAIVLGTAAAAGVANTPIRSDGTIVAFDATAPVTQAGGDVAATGAAAVAARRDHKHGMPTGLTHGTSTVNTSETTTSTSYTDLATPGPSLTLAPGITQDHIYHLSVMALHATATAFASLEGLDDGIQAYTPSSEQAQSCRPYIVASVPSGTAKSAKYKVSAGTGTFSNRRLVGHVI